MHRQLGVVDRHEVLHLADAVLGEEARDEDVGVREVELLGGPSPRRSGGARRSRPAPCRGSRRTRSARRRTDSSTSRSCRWCRPARSCAGRRRARARRSGGSPSRARGRAPCSPISASSSCAATIAAPRTPACAPWRASRIVVWRPSPGHRVLLRDPLGGVEQQVAGHRDAAADDDLLRVEDVDRVGDPDPEALAEDVEHAQRVGVAGLGAVDDVVARDLAVLLEPLAEERVLLLARLALGEPVERAARREVLERPRQRVLALGRRRAVLEVEPDHRVAELAGARRPAVEAPVEHQAAADAGADGEHHEVRAHQLARSRRTPRRAPRTTRRSRCRPGCPALLRQQLAQRQVGERDVDAVRDPAGLELDDRGQADPDRDGVVGRAGAAISSTICATSLSESDTSVLTSSCVSSLPSLSVADAIFVPPTSRPMNSPSI